MRFDRTEPGQQELRLIDQLSRCDVVDLTGVVNAVGAVGEMRGHQRPRWCVKFRLAAWRVGHAQVRREPLACFKRVDEPGHLVNRIPADSVVRLRARVLDNNETGMPQAMIEDFVAMETSDSELSTILRELIKPITIEDAVFGTLTFNRRHTAYEREASWNGKPVQLSLWANTPEEFHASLRIAHALWSDEASWAKRVVERVTRELFAPDGLNRPAVGDETITPERFWQGITLASVSTGDNSFCFWYENDEMLAHHSLLVVGNLVDGVISVELAG